MRWFETQGERIYYMHMSLVLQVLNKAGLVQQKHIYHRGQFLLQALYTADVV